MNRSAAADPEPGRGPGALGECLMSHRKLWNTPLLVALIAAAAQVLAAIIHRL